MLGSALGNNQPAIDSRLQGRTSEHTSRLSAHSIPLLVVALICSLSSMEKLHAHDMRYMVDTFLNGLYASPGDVFEALRPVGAHSAAPTSMRRKRKDTLLRLDQRRKGWGYDQQVIAQLTAPEQSTVYKKRPQENSTTARRLLQDIVVLKKEMAATTRRLSQATQANRQVMDELSKLHNLIGRDKALQNTHQALLRQIIDLERQAQLLDIEHSALQDHIRGNWMLVTFVVLVSGLVLGLLATTRL